MTKAKPEIAVLVDQHSSDGDKILRPFITEMEKKPPPPILYHYTDDKGLLGILQSGKIWLTDVFHLNDPAEIRHGVSPAEDALRRFGTQNGARPEINTFAESFGQLLRRGGVEASAHYFVSCFSDTPDELGQWRAYADDGKGYALGFDGEALETAFTKRKGKPVPENMTFPVTYDDAQLNSLQNRLVNSVLPCISAPRGKHLTSAEINGYMRDLSVAFSLNVLRTAIFFKHEAYRNEHEYRLMQIQRGDRPAKSVRFRSRPYELVRYVEFDWRSVAAGALKEIVVGPAAGSNRTALFASDCLRAYHPGQNVEVRQSALPYRSLR